MIKNIAKSILRAIFPQKICDKIGIGPKEKSRKNLVVSSYIYGIDDQERE